MTSSEEGGAPAAYRWFVIFWVIAGYFHIWNQIPWPAEPFEPTPARVVTELGMLGAGLWALARPRQALPFFVFLVWELAHGLRDVPRVANHWWITTLVAANMVGVGVAVWRRDGQLSPARWFEGFAPGNRGLILVTYAFAAWAKLNTSFLDPEISCAAVTWVRIGTEWFTWLPVGPIWQQIAIWATIVVELAMPALLVTRYRGWAVLGGALFHYLISFTPILRVPDFCALLFAQWFLFTPTAVVARHDAQMERLKALLPAVTWPRAIGVVLGYHALIWGAQASVGRFDAGRWFEVLRLQGFSIYAVTWMVLYTFALVATPAAEARAPQPGLLRLATGGIGAWQAAILAVAVASGLSPYLGLRTRANLAMFSNLRTEDHRPNHLFMPQLYLTDHQLDLVDVVDTDIVKVRKELAYGGRLTWWELRYRAQEQPDGSVTYRRGGVERAVARVGDDPELMAPFGFGETRLWIFRPVDADGKSVCQW
jgi:hypothetical protein